MRVNRDRPHKADIAAVIDAWGITDPDSRQLLAGIGMKDGALGQIDSTLKIAHMLAEGAGQRLDANWIRTAWSNRDMGGAS